VESESGNTPTRPAAQEERKPSEPGNTGPSEPDGEPAPSGGKTGFDFTPSTSSKTAAVGDSKVIYQPTSDGIELISLRTPAAKRNKGSGRDALKSLTDAADEANMPVKLTASPLDKRTYLVKLVRFYQSMGFELTGKSGNMAGDPIMVRQPSKQEVIQGGKAGNSPESSFLKDALEQGNLSESLQTATDAFKSMDTKQFEAFMDDADINVWGSKKDMLQQFTDYVQTLKEKQQPTPANTDWLDAIEKNVVEYAEQHPHRSQNFTTLYNEIAKPAGISVQDFKQGMAQLSKDKKISLRPWTGATSSLQDSHGQDATDLLIDMGAENKFFADPISRHQKTTMAQEPVHEQGATKEETATNTANQPLTALTLAQQIIDRGQSTLTAKQAKYLHSLARKAKHIKVPASGGYEHWRIVSDRDKQHAREKGHQLQDPFIDFNYSAGGRGRSWIELKQPGEDQPERHSMKHLHQFAKAAFINLYGDGGEV